MTPLRDRVVDASVLIVLADIGRLDLLTLGDRAALIAETVFQEVQAGEEHASARQALLILEDTREGAVASAAMLLRQAEQTDWFLPPDALLTVELTALGETWP